MQSLWIAGLKRENGVRDRRAEHTIRETDSGPVAGMAN